MCGRRTSLAAAPTAPGASSSTTRAWTRSRRRRPPEMRDAPRMFLAALAGYATVMAGRWAGSAIAGLAFPQTGAPFPTTPFLAITVAVGFLAAVAGGYLSVRLSPASHRLGTMAVLVLIVLGA